MMHTLYDLVSGPLVWLSFLVFLGGGCYRLISMALLARKKDGTVYAYMSLKFALRSIFHWITPFATLNMRKQPLMTVVTFTFHICLLLVPVFLLAHVLLWQESWNIYWWHLPEMVADGMSVLVILACGYFLFRRLMRPEVKYLTTPGDFVLLAVVAAPFITGFWAYHQWPGYPIALLLHMLCGEIMLAAIPFTRLSHMLFFPLTRGYIGSEFGAVRNVKDW